jgi:hypothetical protein
MNVFQRQLLLDGKSLAELADLAGCRRSLDYYGGPLTAPQRVSAEEFERTMAQVNRDRRRELK